MKRTLPNRPQPQSHRRRGVALVLFAILLFVLLPLTALVIDLAYIQLTRRQMQTAVNTAALEGLRFRDESAVDGRQEATNLVTNIFDDDFNAANGDSLSFGAGPVVNYRGGIPISDGTFRASATFDSSGIGVYDPLLASNTTNSVEGDLVAGNWVFDPSESDHDEHVEATDYSREDFAAVSEADSQAGDYDAFLVRMRRTNESFADSNIATAGPPVPFLFGRGIINTPEFMDILQRGTIVRATAIARTAPAIQAGVAVPSRNITGLVNLQMDVSFWRTGSPVPTGTDQSIHAQVFTQALINVTCVGQQTFMHEPAEGLSSTEGYVVLTDGAVNDLDGNPTRRIVGFGFATGISVSGNVVTFSRDLPQQIGSRNASATCSPPPADWQNVDLASLFTRINALNEQELLLLAPALARTIE